jgi:hypothetical protein
MRRFLKIYSRLPSIAAAADKAGISESIVYRWKRTSPWFAERCKRAERSGIDYAFGRLFQKGVDNLDTAALLAILRAYRPEFQPKPKEVTHTHTETKVSASFASTTISASQLTDAEIAEMDRILKKMGVPEQLLQAEQLALEGATAKPPTP